MNRPLHALCLTAVLASTACAVNIDQEGYIAREEKRFPAETAVDLHLYTFDGAVEVRSWDRPEILIEVEKRGQDQEAVSKIQIVADRSGNRIQIEARHAGSRSFVGIGRFTSPSAKFIASVPRKTNLVVRTGDGPVVVEGVAGGAARRTRTG